MVARIAQYLTLLVCGAVLVSCGTKRNAWYNTSFFKPLFGDFDTVEDVPETPRESRRLYARGRYLVKSLAACGTCHGATLTDPNSALSGGRVMTDEYGEVVAANITSDISTGIGGWSIASIARAITSSIDKDGQALSLKAHEGYHSIADRDARAIATYLKKTKSVSHEVERRDIGGLTRRSYGLVSRHKPRKGYVPQPKSASSALYGQYLVQSVADCGRCHDDLSQLIVVDSQIDREKVLKRHLHSKKPQRSKSGFKSCPTQFYRTMTSTDTQAIAKFLGEK